jgi:hypothetical protein
VIRFSSVLALVEVAGGAQRPRLDERVVDELEDDVAIESAREGAVGQPLMEWVE